MLGEKPTDFALGASVAGTCPVAYGCIQLHTEEFMHVRL